jgi:glycosyltransferase involved in cell wall biosynthesis
MGADDRSGGFDIEFSLALHTKTGKYFIGRDLIAAAGDLVHRQLFWRLSLGGVPRGLAARIIGRLLVLEVDARVRWPLFDRLVPRRRPRRRVIHMDAFTVLLHRLSPGDLVICHDIGPLTHPALFDAPVVAAYHKAYAEIAAARPHMVFDSLASQSAFQARFPGPFASQRMIYPALRAEVTAGAATPAPGVAAPFLLTVGSLGDRKNQAGAIAAFERSGLAERGVSYVLCGGREPGFERVAAAAQATPGVLMLPYVTDETLNWLYRNASGFVLVSLLEGFGIPVAEATARGLVPLVSEGSVLQEVAGDGALLADPRDLEQIAEGMRRLVAMPDAERQRRLADLARSVTRFNPAAVAKDWRDALAEVERPAPSRVASRGAMR